MSCRSCNSHFKDKLKFKRVLRNKSRLACLLTELECPVEQCDCKLAVAVFSPCNKIIKSLNSWAEKDLRDDLVQPLHLISSTEENTEDTRFEFGQYDRARVRVSWFLVYAYSSSLHYFTRPRTGNEKTFILALPSI